MPATEVLAFPEKSVILITGINSFIGSHIANDFLARGYNVRGTIRDLKKNEWMSTFFEQKYGCGRFELIQLPNLHTENAFDEVVKGVSAIIHAAHIMSLSPDPNEVIPEVLAAALHALKAAYMEPSVKRFIYTSSSSTLYFPEFDDSKTRVTEDTWNEDAIRQAWAPPPYTPDRGMAVYGASKTQSEKAIWKFHEKHRHERPDLVVNTVIGPVNLGKPVQVLSQGYPSTSGFIPLLLEGQTFPMDTFFPRQFYVHVQDFARLHAAAVILQDVQDQRIFAYAGRFNWDMILAKLREMRPGETLPDDFSDGYDPHEIVPRDKAEKLLRILGRSGWIGLDECIADNIEGL